MDSGKTETEDFEASEVISEKIPDYARFGLQSGVIVMESETMGMKQFITMYFRDWGKEMTNEIQMNVMGQKLHIISVVKDGWIFEADLISKKGTKKQIDTMSYDQLNYLNIEDNMQMKGFEIKKTGQTEILNRQCDEYSISMKQQGLEVKTAVWKGITVRSEAKVMGMTVKINVTDIQENVEIPDEKFEVPNDIVFEDAPPQTK